MGLYAATAFAVNKSELLLTHRTNKAYPFSFACFFSGDLTPTKGTEAFAINLIMFFQDKLFSPIIELEGKFLRHFYFRIKFRIFLQNFPKIFGLPPNLLVTFAPRLRRPSKTLRRRSTRSTLRGGRGLHTFHPKGGPLKGRPPGSGKVFFSTKNIIFVFNYPDSIVELVSLFSEKVFFGFWRSKK